MHPPFETVPEDLYVLVLSYESEVDKEQLKMIRDLLAKTENDPAGEPMLITSEVKNER